jgi:hypothetical protein
MTPVRTRRELAEQVRDLMKNVIREGKKIGRELEPKMLPVLKRMKLRIEKLIAKLEERAAKKHG